MCVARESCLATRCPGAQRPYAMQNVRRKVHRCTGGGLCWALGVSVLAERCARIAWRLWRAALSNGWIDWNVDEAQHGGGVIERGFATRRSVRVCLFANILVFGLPLVTRKFAPGIRRKRCNAG